MPDGNATGIPRRALGPFTADNLRVILKEVLKGSQTLPAWGEMEGLAGSLNRTHATFAFAAATANQSKRTADKVRNALDVLMEFFEQRRRACYPESGGGPNLQIVDREKRLHDRFDAFLQAFGEHDFDLNMDAGLLMPHIDHWHDVAGTIAGAFKAAMARANGPKNFGLSNDGPVPRFISAVVPLITGETPTVGAVGKYLKDRARQQRGE
jgi:hypothetical protein